MTKTLAAFGGSPAFDSPLYVGKPLTEPAVEEKYFTLMRRVFANRYFTNNGPMVKDLEAQVASAHGVSRSVAMCNATVAMILVLKALKLEGEIILPSFTFIATAHSCLFENLTPVFCDVEPDTLTIDPVKAESLVTERTSAIIGVHLFGNVCDIPALESLAKRKGLKLVFDSAHAYGCAYGDRSIGGFGDAEVLSFHATKFFSTFEGGAALTNNLELARDLEYLRNFGFVDYDDVRHLGINGKMTESSAAMGLASLSAVDGRVEMFQKNINRYSEAISRIPGLSMLKIGVRGKSNWQYAVMFVDEKEYGTPRDVLYKALWKENIMARRYFYPGCHGMEPYRTMFPSASERLPVTMDAVSRALCLPNNLDDPERDIEKIAEVLAAVRENSAKVRKWAEQ